MIKLISFLLRSSKATVILAVTAGLISGVCTSGLVALINVALNAGQPVSRTLIMGFGALCVVLPVSRLMSQYTLIKIGQKAVRDIRIQLGRQILSTPMRSLEEIGSHRLMAVLTDDVGAISTGLVGIPMLCLQGAVVVTALVYLNVLSWKLFLLILASMVFGVLTVQIGVRIALSYLRLARKQEDALFKHLRSLLDGAKELKLHNDRRNAFLSEVLEASAASFQRYNVKGNTILTAAISWAHVTFFVLMGLLLFILPTFTSVSAETLNGFAITMLYLLVPMDVIGAILPTLGRAGVALDNVSSIGLSLQSNAEDDSLPHSKVQDGLESVELSSITHNYYREQENSTFTLGPITLKLKAGEVVFLVGGNGSGKTTLAKLITGLYTPERGKILLNGKAVTDQNREFYRQHFSVVFSDFFLFENFLGIKGEDVQKKAAQYLVRLQLNHKVRIEDGALSTIELSQGQRKRLALLTAYLEDRPIYVFDEWAADQDPQFKDIFYLQILPELKARGKTVLVISHDDRYYNVADRIIKLEYGKLDYDQCVAPVNGLADSMEGSNGSSGEEVTTRHMPFEQAREPETINDQFRI
jgi:putative ATP-binding cassette transporter